MLALVFWLAAGEVVASGALGDGWHGVSARGLGGRRSAPGRRFWRPRARIVEAQHPLPYVGNAVNLFVLFALALALVLERLGHLPGAASGITTSEARATSGQAEEPESIWGLTEEALAARKALAQRVHAAGGKTRQVWDNPILWREIATWAYGRKMLVIRAGLSGAGRPGGLCALYGLVHARARPGHGLGGAGAGAAVRAEPGAGQRPGRDVADQRARRAARSTCCWSPT